MGRVYVWLNIHDTFYMLCNPPTPHRRGTLFGLSEHWRQEFLQIVCLHMIAFLFYPMVHPSSHGEGCVTPFPGCPSYSDAARYICFANPHIVSCSLRIIQFSNGIEGRYHVPTKLGVCKSRHFPMHKLTQKDHIRCRKRFWLWDLLLLIFYNCFHLQDSTRLKSPTEEITAVISNQCWLQLFFLQLIFFYNWLFYNCFLYNCIIATFTLWFTPVRMGRVFVWPHFQVARFIRMPRGTLVVKWQGGTLHTI